MNKRILFVTGLILSVMLMSGVVMAAESRTTTAQVTIPEFISLTVDNTLDFGSLTPGSQNQTGTAPGQIPHLNVIIGVETNINIDLYTKANDQYFRAGTNNFDIAPSRFWWASSEHTMTGYTTSNTQVYFDEAPATLWVQHGLGIPPATKAGAYTNSILITAIKTGETITT